MDESRSLIADAVPARVKSTLGWKKSSTKDQPAAGLPSVIGILVPGPPGPRGNHKWSAVIFFTYTAPADRPPVR